MMIRDYGKRVTVRAQGEKVEAREGEYALEPLLRAGFDIPHVCYHESLGPIQTCDTCLVEVNGELVRSCALPVTDGLELSPDTPRAEAARAEAMQRLLKNHDLYCTICDNNNGDCTLHNAVKQAGLTHQTHSFAPKPYPIDDSNPFYRYDPDQCILCGRCVEACQNVQVNETLTIDWESPNPRVLWDGGRAVNDSSCVSCGHCVTVCPCNALMEKTMLGEAGHFTRMLPVLKAPATAFVKSLEAHTGLGPVFALSDAEAALREGDVQKTKTVCTYCGVGCAFDVWTRGRTLLKIQPRAEAPANGISSCIKGKFGWDFVTSPERLKMPLIRDGERFREASWDEALALIARRLTDLKTAHGPDSLGFIGSSKCSNEESYLIQKLARAVIGTNNVDNCSRYCQSPATVGLWRTVGHGGDAGSLHDVERAALVLIVGSNTAESHPVLATRVKRSQKLRGQTVIVADLRRHEMAERADVFLKPKPGTDLVWLSALSRYILDNGLADEGFLLERVNGLRAYRESLEPFTLDYAEKTTGIPASTLKDVAEQIAAADGVCALWAMGITQHTGGSDASTAISNLLLVTGNYGKPGAGAYPLRGHNNVQGTSDFGSITTFFPGYQPVADEAVRDKFGAAWGVSLSDTPGLNNHQMVSAIHDGRLRGLYIMGEDMAVVDANANHVQAAFEKLEFLVVQELFFSTTASFADVVLPAAASLEKDGTFTNTERRVQRFHAAMPPYAQSRPDWRILQDVARALGQDWGYAHPGDIMAEAARLSPLFAGVSYERLEGYQSLQWPVQRDGTDTPLLYEDAFAFPDGRARLYPLAWIAPGEQPDEMYDLHLNNGRVLEHFHAGNMTYRSPGITEKVPDTFVEVSPELASERGLDSGDFVRLVSRRGAVRVRVLVTERVSGRELYMPMNSSGEAINRLTGDAVDRASDTPAYKELAVRLEPLGQSGQPPLPRHNPRYGQPTPQAGVEVERKWARLDYRLPGGD